ncbi:MAG: hypothetical protein U0703_09730 [Anaerolineae bacterium]
MQNRLWQLVEQDFRPENLIHYETLFTVGNGYLGARGTFEEGFDGDTPATLVHGVYDHAPESPIPELVNLPNWLPIQITIDGTPFRLGSKTDGAAGAVLGYQRWLDLYRGLLCREVLFRAASGSIVRLIFERFASLSDQHILAQRVRMITVEGSPTIRIEAALDGDVTNGGIHHWLPDIETTAEGSLIGLGLTTGQSGYRVGVASVSGVAAPSRFAGGRRAGAHSRERVHPEARRIGHLREIHRRLYQPRPRSAARSRAPARTGSRACRVRGAASTASGGVGEVLGDQRHSA